MSPEERDELIQFILQSQSNAAERHQELMTQMEGHTAELREHTAELREHTAELREHTTQIQALASVSRDLVEVARIHSRRLDRLDNLNP